MTKHHDNPPSSEGLLDQLAQEARVINTAAAVLPEEGELNGDQVREVAERLDAYLSAKRLTPFVVGRQTGRAVSSIESFLKGAYGGNVSKLARLINRWLDQHQGGEEKFSHTYTSTKVTDRMLTLMKLAQRERQIGVITGPSGIGKSMVCQAAASGEIPGATHVHCLQGSSTAFQFAQLWAAELQLKARGGLFQVQRAIIEQLRGSDRLQIIDEAQYLHTKAANVIRDVCKVAGVGVALVGTVDIERNINDRTQFYGQFERLIVARYNIVEEHVQNGGRPLYTVEEIVRFAASRKLKLSGDAAEFATRLACVPGYGGLGRLGNILFVASKVAKTGTITLKNLKAAVKHGLGAQHAERWSIEASRLKATA